MPQTRISCPRCRQPLMADISQLFDNGTDPDAKQKILSGQFNLIQCPNCSYQGNASTPLVYHDPDKELLLTYFPPELGMPVNEQERMIGPLITQVTNRLPPEKRKAYLLRPQSMLTLQTLRDKVLEADGITKEMIKAQQDRLNLLQRLMSATSDEARAEIAKQEDALMDESFFTLLNRLVEASLAGGDEESARALAELHQQLLPLTTVGQALQSQAQEAEAALKTLQDASQQGLTREKLLEIIIEAPNEARLSALVGLARSGMDYQFFQALSERINRTGGEEQVRLMELRDTLLRLTRQIDEEMQRQMAETHKLLDTILAAEDVGKATAENIQAFDNLFIEMLKAELQTARQTNDQARFNKLQEIIAVLQQYSAPPPEIALIEEMLAAADDAAMRQVLESNRDKINPDFLQFFMGLVSQAQSQNQDPQVVEKLNAAYRAALRFSMENSLNA